MTWFYLTGFIFLMGGEINAIIEHWSPDGKAQGARAPGEAPLPARERPSAMPAGAADSADAAARAKGGIPPEAGRAPMKSHGRFPRWLRRLLIASGIVVALVVIIRLVLDPVATHFTRKALREAEGIRGDFHSVHVTVFPPGYQIRRIKIIEHPGDDWKHPLFYAERVVATLDMSELLHARVAARARLDEPKIVISNRGKKEEKRRRARVCPTCATRWSARCRRG